MKKIYVDPPEGHKYGFPKYFMEEERPENLNKWLTDNGYPAQLIIDYANYFFVRTWKSGLTAEEVYNDFFDTEHRYINLSKKESFYSNDRFFIYTPPANDDWVEAIFKRALEMQKKYGGSYITVPKQNYIALDIGNCD